MPELQHDTKRLNCPDQQLNFFSELLEDGYDLRLKVTGRSMAPFLENGSVVTLSRVPVSALRIGDIIYCRCSEGSFMLHRLIKIDEDLLVTKGDALRSFDPPVDKSDYKGKVIRIEQNESDGVFYRNMERTSARVFNYLLGRYHQLRVYYNFIYVRFKSKLIDPHTCIH